MAHVVVSCPGGGVAYDTLAALFTHLYGGPVLDCMRICQKVFNSKSMPGASAAQLIEDSCKACVTDTGDRCTLLVLCDALFMDKLLSMMDISKILCDYGVDSVWLTKLTEDDFRKRSCGLCELNAGFIAVSPVTFRLGNGLEKTLKLLDQEGNVELLELRRSLMTCDKEIDGECETD